MGETFTYFEGLEKISCALDVLFTRKITPFIRYDMIDFEVRRKASRLFVDLKCDVILSQQVHNVLDRHSYTDLSKRFRQLESYIKEAVQIYGNDARTSGGAHQGISGKDRAAGERAEDDEGSSSRAQGLGTDI